MAQLDVEGVTLTFGGVAALSGVSMRVEAGELVSIIGPNGAGKTSLLNCISGFYHPERGRILFEGQDLTRASPHEVTRKGIARAFQNIELFSGLTVLENLLLARHTHLSYGLLQAGLFYGRALAEEVRNRRVVTVGYGYASEVIGTIDVNHSTTYDGVRALVRPLVQRYLNLSSEALTLSSDYCYLI